MLGMNVTAKQSNPQQSKPQQSKPQQSKPQQAVELRTIGRGFKDASLHMEFIVNLITLK
jgi:hypothetical protein